MSNEAAEGEEGAQVGSEQTANFASQIPWDPVSYHGGQSATMGSSQLLRDPVRYRGGQSDFLEYEVTNTLEPTLLFMCSDWDSLKVSLWLRNIIREDISHSKLDSSILSTGLGWSYLSLRHLQPGGTEELLSDNQIQISPQLKFSLHFTPIQSTDPVTVKLILAGNLSSLEYIQFAGLASNSLWIRRRQSILLQMMNMLRIPDRMSAISITLSLHLAAPHVPRLHVIRVIARTNNNQGPILRREVKTNCYFPI